MRRQFWHVLNFSHPDRLGDRTLPLIPTIAAVSFKCLANAGKIEGNVLWFSIYAYFEPDKYVDVDQYLAGVP